MEGEMLDLFLREIFRGVGFQRHAIVTHALGSMSAHILVPLTSDLAILLVELVVEW